MFLLQKEPNMSQILLKLRLIGNRTSCRPIRSVIILVIKQIGLPLRGRPILLITRMITDRIGLHSVLLPLLIIVIYSFSKRFSNTPYNEMLKLYIFRKKIHTSKYNVKIAA